MVNPGVEIDLTEFNEQIKETIAKARKIGADLRPAFLSIISSWFKGNRAIFELRGPGKYQDLSPAYKKAKLREVGFIYPILRKKGKLEDALTIPGADGSIAVAGVDGMEVGVDGKAIPYAIYHQSPLPRTKIPFRPFVLIGAEQVSPPGLNRRFDDWVTIIENYLNTLAKAV